MEKRLTYETESTCHVHTTLPTWHALAKNELMKFLVDFPFFFFLNVHVIARVAIFPSVTTRKLYVYTFPSQERRGMFVCRFHQRCLSRLLE